MTPSGLSNTPPLLYQIYSLVCPPITMFWKTFRVLHLMGQHVWPSWFYPLWCWGWPGARGYANNKTFANTFVPPLSIENDITISFNSLAYFVLYLLISLILLLYIMHPLVNYHSSSVLIVLWLIILPMTYFDTSWPLCVESLLPDLLLNLISVIWLLKFLYFDRNVGLQSHSIHVL